MKQITPPELAGDQLKPSWRSPNFYDLSSTQTASGLVGPDTETKCGGGGGLMTPV